MAERRGRAYLVREVPRWSRENHCFSCHNNGDATRALLAASEPQVPEEVLADTLNWLGRPERWDGNPADAAFSDKRLARIQFAGALASAVESGRVRERGSLDRAARMVAADQAADGSWPIDELGTIGSPATYGRMLASAMARRTLEAAGPARYSQSIARAAAWLRERPIANVVDASAVLLGLSADEPADRKRRREAFELLSRAQGDDGGWGPYVRSASEPFDTALALLALAKWPNRGETGPRIARGRTYLAASQSKEGNWPETTRPAGGESYAQRLSTTGWVMLALTATR
jgi:hypothetical protein